MQTEISWINNVTPFVFSIIQTIVTRMIEGRESPHYIEESFQNVISCL